MSVITAEEVLDSVGVPRGPHSDDGDSSAFRAEQIGSDVDAHPAHVPLSREKLHESTQRSFGVSRTIRSLSTLPRLWTLEPLTLSLVGIRPTR